MANATIVSRDGNPEVWPLENVQAKLREGYITLEQWKEICLAEEERKYQAWMHDPATRTERFASLRAARDAKLAETDYLLASDYPIDSGRLSKVKAYRQALRDMPEHPDAPWDGGGEATPWPELQI